MPPLTWATVEPANLPTVVPPLIDPLRISNPHRSREQGDRCGGVAKPPTTALPPVALAVRTATLEPMITFGSNCPAGSSCHERVVVIRTDFRASLANEQRRGACNLATNKP
jgi:hypothetical protein